MSQTRHSRFTWTPELSDRARQLRDSRVSLRDIGKELGAGKDTIRRHLATLPEPPGPSEPPVSQLPATPELPVSQLLTLPELLEARVPAPPVPPVSQTFRARVAQRNVTALTTLAQLRDTVALVVAARFPQLILDTTGLRQIEDELRQHAATLLALADSIRDRDPARALPPQPAGHDRGLAQH